MQVWNTVIATYKYFKTISGHYKHGQTLIPPRIIHKKDRRKAGSNFVRMNKGIGSIQDSEQAAEKEYLTVFFFVPLFHFYKLPYIHCISIQPLIHTRAHYWSFPLQTVINSKPDDNTTFSITSA